MATSTHQHDEKNAPPDDSRRTESPCSCTEIKTAIADKIHKIAAALSETAHQHDPQSDLDQHLRDASQWLDQSAEYIREFDAGEADIKIRNYTREHPERSLLIAGAVGLVIGAVYRRYR